MPAAAAAADNITAVHDPPVTSWRGQETIVTPSQFFGCLRIAGKSYDRKKSIKKFN